MSARTTRKRARTEAEDAVKQELDAVDASTAAQHRDSDSPFLPTVGECDPRPNDAAPAPERDPEFWFSDGTIILVAKSVEFRFYRALLADRSPVFKALFAEQHPSRLEPIDEHHAIPCPVVPLADCPEDLRHILRAYVSGKQTSFVGATKPSFNQISAFIRLGRKYELNELYEQSRKFLKSHYSNDLEVWAKHTYWEPPNWAGNACIGVVNLARLINEPSILPTALLSCVYLDDLIMNGCRREDGSVEPLSDEDLARCFKASRATRQASLAGVMRTFRDTVSPACSKEKSCALVLGGALQKMETHMELLMTGSPFRLELKNLLKRDGKVRTCASCTAMVEERMKKERAELWARLPELLDVEVPGWGNGVPQNGAA